MDPAEPGRVWGAVSLYDLGNAEVVEGRDRVLGGALGPRAVLPVRNQT
ncbi:hypothetical protein [Micromonospora sp. NPDC048830]